MYTEQYVSNMRDRIREVCVVALYFELLSLICNSLVHSQQVFEIIQTPRIRSPLCSLSFSVTNDHHRTIGHQISNLSLSQ